MIAWQLPLLMTQRGITSAAALQRELAALGITRSRSGVFRLIDHAPRNVSLQLLRALCVILRCTPNDLLLGPDRGASALPFPEPPPIVLYRR